MSSSAAISRARGGESFWARFREVFRGWSRPRWNGWDDPVFENPWQRYWGNTYGAELKRWILKPVFDGLEKTGRMGDLIVDAGSGALPVTTLLDPRQGRRWIFIDIAADTASNFANQLKVRLDVEKIGEPGAYSCRKALRRAAHFLRIDPRSAEVARADTIVVSDVLNYVDFEKVLRGFSNFVKPGGRFVVCNLPMRGNQSLFSGKGLRDNCLLFGFLEGIGFDLEEKHFPKREPGVTTEAGELLVLVAKKRE
ncbi:MAG TPA: hypothetical protein VHY22_16970 [Chthoniobacteraceae bacterium]|jgi:SAM-dependent methyltransferase|nr:hypothetical protein [Chthoniobacteraceae bacterium]